MALTLFIILALVLALLSVGLTLQINRLKRELSDYRQWADNEIERVSRADPETGALKALPFIEQLDNECRRAVREFTPLTLMQLDIQLLDSDLEFSAVLRQAAEILGHQLSRPGDQLGRCAEQQLALLLPATNEHAGSFAERCYQAVLEAFAPGQIQLTLGACTFQPTAALCAEMAQQLVTETLVNALETAPGTVVFHAEYSHDFNPTYA
ncbi:nucleotidyl cyclase domain-containing protein [Nitrincola iocasae]|uniref:GGDEF domain-containing protein n=1 Tax=Nitrincola iocasae TaxID=2614693 RepID=A0A5J6LDG6_9GAMM|nr:GGDEF domain-containing protein [Nitrincola iocasae]QEW06282.1 GGDEF domain-containing protein [Nitrincola iocasae]